MNVRHLLRAAAALALAVGLAAPVWAQINTGVIDGRVVDETKAVVAGATITAKNVAPGLTRTATSGATGLFRLGSVPAGTYDVTAELSGFATTVFKGADVRIASTVPLDVTMKVSAQQETVTVTGETSLISTTTSDVGQVITSQVIETLPMNGRKFQDLSLLVPGTRAANYYDPTKTEVGGVSYGGAG